MRVIGSNRLHRKIRVHPGKFSAVPAGLFRCRLRIGLALFRLSLRACTAPDVLWRWLVLAKFMGLSLMRAAYAVVSSAA
jgi:hypothetical protein